MLALWSLPSRNSYQPEYRRIEARKGLSEFADIVTGCWRSARLHRTFFARCESRPQETLVATTPRKSRIH